MRQRPCGRRSIRRNLSGIAKEVTRDTRRRMMYVTYVVPRTNSMVPCMADRQEMTNTGTYSLTAVLSPVIPVITSQSSPKMQQLTQLVIFASSSTSVVQRLRPTRRTHKIGSELREIFCCFTANQLTELRALNMELLHVNALATSSCRRRASSMRQMRRASQASGP